MQSTRFAPRFLLLAVVTLSVASQTALAQPTNSQFPAPTSNIETEQFAGALEAGTLTRLRHATEAEDAGFLPPGRRLGDVLLAYRRWGGDEWQTASTASLEWEIDDAPSDGADRLRRILRTYRITSDAAGEDDAVTIELQVAFELAANAIRWTIALENRSPQPVEIGDLAIPLPIGSARGGRGRPATPIMKHHFVSGHGSFFFWQRASGGPMLVMTPSPSTPLEYWEPPQRGPSDGGRPGGRGDSSPESAFRAFIHSAASGARAAERGTKWRQPHTSLTLAPAGQPSATREYGFELRWADSLDAIRDLLVAKGGVDVELVPGMTVPSDLAATVALRSREPIRELAAEYPAETAIEPLGRRGDYELYSIRFRRLGENRVTIRYGDGRSTYLEFFATEPVETLIKKRAAFLAKSQHRDPSKWYRGLISDWNMETQVLLGPDNYDRIRGFRIYAVTCDDPGLGKPAFLAAKNAEYPVAVEIAALDDYIEHFVWGGLQRTTDETYPYGIYGIPDWKQNRESDDPGRNGRLHIWRCYDYPHIVLLYHSMYRAARQAPHIATRLPPEEYLRRAAGTAIAMFTVPREVEGWSAYGTGFYNELVIVDLLRDLEAAGMRAEADKLRGHWERKVKRFVLDNPDLFRSEYAFDSTGFESTHALARYAMQHANDDATVGLGVTPAAAREFLDRQMAANLFCRGTIEPAYYYLGSDYRGGGGNGYTLTYMSQMGGWAVLDYALHYAQRNRDDLLRLGSASALSAWALVNSGTPQSNYGYWYPGEGNDGAAGGGFEPAPFGMTWLGQPHHRGAWYYACESDLGFSGALRAARCIVADDPVFGHIALGGKLATGEGSLHVLHRDGVRRRFHALLGKADLHIELDGGRFAADRPIQLAEDASRVEFAVESDSRQEHTVRIQLGGWPGSYRLIDGAHNANSVNLAEGESAQVEVTIQGGSTLTTLTLEKVTSPARD